MPDPILAVGGGGRLAAIDLNHYSPAIGEESFGMKGHAVVVTSADRALRSRALLRKQMCVL